MTFSLADMAARLGDEPRWVDARGALLSGSCDVLLESDDDLIVVPRFSDFLSVIGHPGATTLEAALRRSSADRPDVIVQPESRDTMAPFLDGWTEEQVIVHGPPEGGLPRTEIPDTIAVIPPGQLLPPCHLSPESRRELDRSGRHTEIAAWVEDGHAVSFCYAAVWTETLWDAAVETVESARGRGLAGHCFRAVAARQQKHGRRPVWAAVASNAASLRAAEKVGMRRLQDQGFSLFSRPAKG